MKKTLKLLLILLLVMTMVVALVACNKNGDQQGTGTPGDSGAVPSTPSQNPTRTFEDLAEGLRLMGDEADSVRHVTSNFTLRVNTVNVTVDYVANYSDDRSEDSQYLLRIFDNNFERTVTFLYYTNNNLYYKLNDKFREITGFSGAAQFDTFVAAMKMFDIGSFLSDESFVTQFAQMGAFVESRNITSHVVTEGVVNVTVSNINLDEMRTTVNEFLREGIGQYGTRLDTLTETLMGFDLSALREVEVGQLTAEKLQVVRTNNVVNDFRVKFHGMQTNNIADYLLDINYAISKNYGEVKPSQYEDPSKVEYKSSPNGNYHYKGTLEVPSLEATFDFNLRAVIDRADNARNNIILEVLNNQGQNLDPDSPYYRREEVVTAYYQEETLYLDLSGLMDNYIRNGIRLSQMNFPRARFEGINISQGLTTLSTYLTEFLQLGYSGNILEQIKDADSQLNRVVSAIESNGTKIIINIDQQTLSNILGDYSNNMIEWIASTLGIREEVIRSALGSDGFDNMSFRLSFDTATEEVELEFYASGELLFRLKMKAAEIPESGVDMTPPASFDYTQFLQFRSPEAINLHLEGSLNLEGSETADFSRFFGALIGDVTGTNTPYIFRIGDTIAFNLDIWQDSVVNVAGAVYLNGDLLFELSTLSTDPNYYAINNVMLGHKYRMSRDGLNESFTDLLGENSLFNSAAVIDVLRRVVGEVDLRFGDDSIEFGLAKRIDENGKVIDPIYDLIGIPNLMGSMHAQIFFVRPDNITLNEREYVLPEIATLPDLVFRSMYEANWHDSVEVTFRDGQNNATVDTFKLTFQGESATLQSNRYYYNPIAKLFGQQVSYQMTLTDTENGTKVVETLVTQEEYVNDNGVLSQRWVDLRRLSLDPSLENPFPDVLYVQYDDGTIGSLPYEIPSFPYTRENVKDRLIGLAPAPYTVYIGRGSIAERTFEIDVEILNRMIQVADDSYIGDVPIVASVTIDPYGFALTRLSDPDYSPIPEILTLTFGSNLDANSTVQMTVGGFDWVLTENGFNLNKINYRGGMYYVEGHYNRLRVALQVTVLGRKVSYLQMTGEQQGEYTIDSLMRDTFIIPTTTTADREIRIYFETGHYRIVGTAPEGYDDWSDDRKDPMCDGYFPIPLSWQFARATGVYSVDEIYAPLVEANGNRTNVNTTQFGLASVGMQQINITVRCPDRRVRESAGTRLVITEFALRDNGELNPDIAPTRSGQKISMVSLTENGVDGSDDFIFDPYEKNPDKRHLPAYIYMTVELGGQMVRRAYPVDWVSSTIIDAKGSIRFPQADECYMLAVGVIGDSSATAQYIYVVIHNLSGRYVDVDMTDPATGQRIEEDDMGTYSISVNQYEQFRLPETFTLLFSEASGIAPERYEVGVDYNWVYTVGDTTYRYDPTSGLWYQLTASGQKDTPSYPFSWQGGNYTVTATVAANNDSGVLEQTISLTLLMERRAVLSDRVTGLWNTMDNDAMPTDPTTQLRYALVNGYSDESGRLLEMLEGVQIGETLLVGAVFPQQGNNVSQVPIVFMLSELEEFINTLKSPLGTSVHTNNLISLTGYLYATLDQNGALQESALTQTVTLNFRIEQRVLDGIGFYDENAHDLLESYIKNGVLDFVWNVEDHVDPENNIPAKSLSITINQPYGVEGRYVSESGADAFGPLLPRQYLEYLFANIRLTFKGIDGSMRTSISLDEVFANFEESLHAEFNDYVLPNGNVTVGDIRSATLHLTRLSNGATVDSYTLIIRVVQDNFIQNNNSSTVLVDTYNANGTIRYGTWYTVSDRVTVSYQRSGNVTYSNLKWYAAGDYTAIYGEGVIHAGDAVTEILPNFFGTMVGNTIDLVTTLPTGREYHLLVNFLPKNLQKTEYDADGEDAAYSIRGGVISIDNVYEVYPFDPNKIPRTLTPKITNRYTLSGDTDENGNPIIIQFTIERWIPAEEFATGGVFDADKLNAKIRSGGITTPTLLATATIPIYEHDTGNYNGTQTVELRISVRMLGEINVQHDTLNFIDNHLDLDPYRDNYGGNFTLPKNVRVSFIDNSGVRITHSFTDADDIQYFILNADDLQQEGVPITNIPYDFTGHLLGDAYGDPEDTLFIKIRLPDGKTGMIYVRFLSRELNEVMFTNRATKLDASGQKVNGELDKLYFIDPYDASTFTVPSTVRLTFKGTSDTIEMAFVWTLTTAGAPFVQNANGDWQFVPSSWAFTGGGIYTFSGTLDGFGVTVQPIQNVRVVIVNRSLQATDLGSHYISNPISYLVSDLNESSTSSLDPLKFFDLGRQPAAGEANYEQLLALYELYQVYLSLTDPVIPSVVWDLTNDDIHYNGFDRQITGVVSYGDVRGEHVTAKISAPKVTFESLVTDIVGNVDHSNIINFNPYTRESVEQTFYVRVSINGQSLVWTFTSETAFNPANPQQRMIIRWGERNSDDRLMEFTLGNYYKSVSVVLRVSRVYRYNYQQIVISGIDFGYGMAGSGTVSLAIDPLNPVVPTEVQAQGQITSAGSGAAETMDLGMVAIKWDNSIYDMPRSGGEKVVNCDLLTPDGNSYRYRVNVGYLDRTPVGFYTAERGFTTESESINRYYLLSQIVNGTRVWYFQVDPLNGDLETGKVDMPKSIRISFAGASSYTQDYMKQAVARLGDALIFNDIEWTNTDGLIKMEGTPKGQPIILEMLSFTIQIGEDGTPSERHYGALGAEFRLELSVAGKSVYETNLSSRAPHADGGYYQLADEAYAIDPYSLDYLDSLFPNSIRVTFEGETVPRLFENLVWTYDEDYLRRPEVINGLLQESNPNAMQLEASFKVYGVDMKIVFPIKVRRIQQEENDAGGISPLYGGKLYVIQGLPMLQQLPRYLYYKFEMNTGDLDVTQVPVMWIHNFEDAASIQSFNRTYLTNTAGTVYHIRTTLGWCAQGNIIFDVEVVSPVMYQVRQNTNEFGFITYSKGSSYYSEIVVARDYNGYYVEGRETVVLPTRVIVNSEGDYLEVNSITYDIAGGFATIACKYVFQTTDADPNLSGNHIGTDEDSAKLSISFTVPIVTYDYTSITQDYDFREEDREYVIDHPGMEIDVADLPLAYDNEGTGRNSLRLLWDLSAVDTRRVGTYTADAWYRNTYGENRLLTLTIRVNPFVFTEDDVELDRQWTDRVYDGKEHDILEYLKIADFLRETGEEGQVQGFTIRYSVDGYYDSDGNFVGVWQSSQPTDVRLDSTGRVIAYYVRIEINDYNVTGYVILPFTISKQVIDADSVGMQVSADNASENLVYEFNGRVQIPYVYGLPGTESYTLTYNLLTLDEFGQPVTDPRTGDYVIADGNRNVTPYNAGTYQVILSFPDLRNYNVRVTSISKLMVITKANVNYNVVTQMVYNGEYRDVIVDGLPENLGDIRVRYTYYDSEMNPLPAGSQVRNAGRYYVTVSIDGGINYPDAINDGSSIYSNLYRVPFEITPKKVTVRVGHVESEYLDALKPLNSGVYLVDATDGTLAGLVGTDSMSIFGQIIVVWTGRTADGIYDTPGGTLTSNHMVGTYILRIQGELSHPNYEIVGYEDGEYVITANGENVVVIRNREELNTRLGLLQDGDTVRWYLMPGDYGSITLNRNASVSIVGSYLIGAATQEIAVTFQSINVLRGAVLIDIVKMNAIAEAALINIGADADSVTINRSQFGNDNSAVLTNSIAVQAAQNFRSVLYMENTVVSGFTRAIHMMGGSVNLRGCTFENNYSGVYVEKGAVTLAQNRFAYTRGDALYIAGNPNRSRDISIINNVFEGNVTAIRTVVELVVELDLLNTFTKNASNVILLN